MRTNYSADYGVHDVLILGGGAAGLAAARFCQKVGLGALVLDKGYYPGGRMCTRSLGEAQLDYGAQFFTATASPLTEWVEELYSHRFLRPWTRTQEESTLHNRVRWVAANGFRYLAKLWSGSWVLTQTHVIGLKPLDASWFVEAADGRTFRGRSLVLTFPLPQALALLEDQAVWARDAIPEVLRRVYYHPCLALLCRTTYPPPWSGWIEPIELTNHQVAFIGDNQHKGLSPVPALTIHASPLFSAAYFNAPAAVILSAIQSALGDLLPPVEEFDIMRWRYSQTANPLTERYWPIEDIALPPLVLAGDAFGRSRIEAAVESGIAAAHWVAERLGVN